MAFSASFLQGSFSGGAITGGGAPAPSFDFNVGSPALNRLGGLDGGSPVQNIQINNNYGGYQDVGGFQGGGFGPFSGGGLGGLNGGFPSPGFLSPLSQLGALGGAQNETDKLFNKTLGDFGKVLEKLLNPEKKMKGKKGKKSGKGKKGNKGGKAKKRGPKKGGAKKPGGSSKRVTNNRSINQNGGNGNDRLNATINNRAST